MKKTYKTYGIKFISVILILYHVNNFGMKGYWSRMRQYLPKNIPTVSSLVGYKPVAASAMPNLEQINTWLKGQDAAMQSKIQQHDFYKNYQYALIDFFKEDPVLKQRALLHGEIASYIMDHPEESKEILDFYADMQNAQSLIEARLKLLPSHAQRFFQGQVEKYGLALSQDKNQQVRDKSWVKKRILRLFFYVIPVLTIAYSVSCLFEIWEKALRPFFFGALNVNNPEEKKMLDLFKLLSVAATGTNIEFRISRDVLDTPICAYYDMFFNFICLTPKFFELLPEARVFVLLHEIRHFMQFNNIEIPLDVIEYAKSCGVQSSSNNLFSIITFFQTGFFWSRAIVEFDADLFAAQQMKGSRFIKGASTSSKSLFSPGTGYLSSDMILNDALYAQRSQTLIELEKSWNGFLSSLIGGNVYIQYVPEHLKQQAAEHLKQQAEKEETPGNYMRELATNEKFVADRESYWKKVVEKSS